MTHFPEAEANEETVFLGAAFTCGAHQHRMVVNEAIKIARLKGKTVVFTWLSLSEAIVVRVNNRSNLRQLSRELEFAIKGSALPFVGPCSEPEKTEGISAIRSLGGEESEEEEED